MLQGSHNLNFPVLSAPFQSINVYIGGTPQPQTEPQSLVCALFAEVDTSGSCPKEPHTPEVLQTKLFPNNKQVGLSLEGPFQP